MSDTRVGAPPAPPRAHLQISDVSDQVVPDFSIAQETILVNRNSRKLQGASFRDLGSKAAPISQGIESKIFKI